MLTAFKDQHKAIASPLLFCRGHQQSLHSPAVTTLSAPSPPKCLGLSQKALLALLESPTHLLLLRHATPMHALAAAIYEHGLGKKHNCLIIL